MLAKIPLLGDCQSFRSFRFDSIAKYWGGSSSASYVGKIHELGLLVNIQTD